MNVIELYNKLGQTYKDLAKEYFGFATYDYKVKTYYDIIDEITCWDDIASFIENNEKLEKLVKFIYDAYMESDSGDITIRKLVETANDIIRENGEDYLYDMDNFTFIDSIVF